MIDQKSRFSGVPSTTLISFFHIEPFGSIERLVANHIGRLSNIICRTHKYYNLWKKVAFYSNTITEHAKKAYRKTPTRLFMLDIANWRIKYNDMY